MECCIHVMTNTIDDGDVLVRGGRISLEGRLGVNLGSTYPTQDAIVPLFASWHPGCRSKVCWDS